MRTDYLGMEAFVAIAELGSFRKAAGFLNLSQTALSHRIKKLETDLGVELFIRSTREVSLTKEAQEILPAIRRNLKELSAAYSSLSEIGRTRADVLAFACLPTVSYNHASPALLQFSRTYPDITVRLEDRPVAQIYELVETGEVEFGISIVGARRWDLEIAEIRTEPYMLFLPRDHPLARQRSVGRADLEGLAFAQISTQSSNRQLVDEALGKYRERMHLMYQIQSPMMALSLVAEGAVVTVLPSVMAKLMGPDVVALPFHDVEITRTLGLVTRRGAALTAPARHLVRLLTQRIAGA